MNGISGFANLLKEDDLTTEERNRYIEVINASASQLLSIINDVLELSRLESTRVPVSQTSFSLNVMIEEIAAILRPKTLKKNLEMSGVKPLALSESFIVGDKEKIKQVLTGLINNALKFTHSGGIKFGYEIRAAKICFYVQDTGIGLPSSEHIRIFERFYQVEQDHRKNYGGTGLGLSIAKEIVGRLGGHIWVESLPGEGATFYFEIPYVASENQEKPARVSADIALLRPLTILIAEDEPVNYEYLHTLLSSRVKVLHWAKNGSEVMPLIKMHHPDMVLMDIKMPVMDGYEATRQVKAMHNNLPVIALTAYSQPDEQQAAFDAGCDHYISKPFRKDELLESMVNVLQMGKSLEKKS
jgi:CheY-like chemotaxis protein